MRPELLSSSVVEVLFPSQYKDMSNFLDEDWVTPDTSSSDSSSGYLVPSNAAVAVPWQDHHQQFSEFYQPLVTPFPDFSNPFDNSNFTPATTVPSQTPETIFLKPRQSPRTFSGNVQDLVYSNNPAPGSTGHQGLGISASPQFSSFQPTVSSPPLSSYSRVSDPELGRGRSSTGPPQTPIPALTPSLSAPVPIAPNPIGLQQLQQAKQMKRVLEESDVSDYGNKRRRSTSTSQPKPASELTDEEELLLKLKQEEGLPWKDIAQQFEIRLGKTYQVPALQMRFKRLRERMRTWTEEDLLALEQAYDYWEKSKFEIISQKMLEFGAQEKWPARSCEKKWEELHPSPEITGQVPSGPIFESGRWFQDPLESEYGTPAPDPSRTPRPGRP